VQDGGGVESGDPTVLHLMAPTAARIRSLNADGRFRGVKTLFFRGGDDAAVAALGECADLTALSSLELGATTVTSAGLIAVGNSKCLSNLESLGLYGSPLTDEEFERIGRGAAFRSLKHLKLRRLPLSDAALLTLARAPAFARIHFLQIEDVPVTAGGVRRLLADRSALGLLHTDRVISPSDVLSLALVLVDCGRAVLAGRTQIEWRPTEHELVVWAEADRVTGLFAGVTDWPAGLRVDHLKVENTPFADGVFAELLGFLALGRIPRVTLSHCGLRNAEAVALATRLPELAITHLDLSENKIGLAGAKALASSAGLANVVSLDLRGNPILKSGRAALAASVHKAALEEINLGGERVDKDEAKELRKAFGKGVKVTMRA
jgi:hypothetical protein